MYMIYVRIPCMLLQNLIFFIHQLQREPNKKYNNRQEIIIPTKNTQFRRNDHTYFPIHFIIYLNPQNTYINC